MGDDPLVTNEFQFTKADAAALRRGVDPWEVSGFYKFIKLYPKIDYKSALAQAAPVVAEIREVSDKSIGQLCCAQVSERRLRRLLESRNREDLSHQLQSVVRLLKRKANPTDIVETIVYWGEDRRRQIAQDYFGGLGDE